LVENVDVEGFNVLDMNAKKVLVALLESEEGLLIKGDLIRKKTGLIPETINDAIRSLNKSLLVDIPYPLKNNPPYEFYAVEVTDFGRQVLEQFK
jgi:hypothetical protein